MKEIAKRLAKALGEVSAAEDGLAELLREIRVAPRAEKTTISKKVEDALARLRLARRDLIDLQTLLVGNDV
jgi:hypothetical protein